MLEIQKYLQEHTLEQLKSEFGIEYSEYQNLICLNYSQIDSPKTLNIVKECRGIVLKIGTWDVIAYPFFRFFNCNEEPNLNFNYSKAIAIQKLDGSLITVFFYNGSWMFSTRSIIENECKINLSNKTFKELFYTTMKKYNDNFDNFNINYSYTFELTALENRIVTIYENPELHLLMVRNLKTLSELSLKDLYKESDSINIDLPEIIKFDGSLEDVIKKANNLKTLEEGYVCCDYSSNINGNYNRVKVKNCSYLAIAHIKDSAARSQRSLIGLIYDGKESEFLQYFKEYKPIIDQIREKYNNYILQIYKDIKKFKDSFALDKKSFAIGIMNKDNKAVNTSFMFKRYTKEISTIDDYFKMLEKQFGRKFLEKYLVDILKLKEINLSSEN